MSPQVSIISPIYGSPEALPELFERTAATMRHLNLSFEFIMVDDRCPKDSWSVIQALANNHKEIVGVRLSRNFGQHPAIYAGLRVSRGEWVVVLDCDLQDQPEEIATLFAETKNGWNIIRALREDRRDSLLRRTFSDLFYSTLSFLTGVKHRAEIANFGIYERKVIDAVLSWSEDHRYFPAAIQWIGFSVKDVPVVHAERKHGRSSYNFMKLMRLALSIIVSFSDKPLRIMAQTGALISALSFIISAGYLTIALFGEFDVPGWASIMISVWFISGVLIFSIGFVGIYVGQVMREAKGRPNYIVDVVDKDSGDRR